MKLGSRFVVLFHTDIRYLVVSTLLAQKGFSFPLVPLSKISCWARGRRDACICMAESLCWSPEATTALLISYIPIQNKKFKVGKKKISCPWMCRSIVGLSFSVLLADSPFFLINWRIIALQCCVGSCHRVAWINQKDIIFFMPIPLCLNYCCFRISLQIR